jgi:hypothetical protein
MKKFQLDEVRTRNPLPPIGYALALYSRECFREPMRVTETKGVNNYTRITALSTDEYKIWSLSSRVYRVDEKRVQLCEISSKRSPLQRSDSGEMNGLMAGNVNETPIDVRNGCRKRERIKRKRTGSRY